MELSSPAMSHDGTAVIDQFLEQVVSSRRVPATFLGVASAKEELYYNRKGERAFGDATKGEVDDRTVLQLFSCTKLVTVVACLQLIDDGKISLHDPEIIATYLPELGELPILQGYDDDGREILSQPTNRITLNMLLTHTSGLSYTFMSPLIYRWSKAHNIPSQLSANAPLSAILHPLLFEPGTQFGYSVGVDWAGVLLSRLTGLSLEDYFQRHIFRPCGMEDTTFFHKDYAERGMELCVWSAEQREAIRAGDHFMSRNYDPALVNPNVGGGAGLFGTAKDYLRFLRAILASADPQNPASWISEESFRLLFTDTLPQEHGSEMRATLAAATKALDLYDPAWFESGKGEGLGYSPGLFISSNPSRYGRSSMSGGWFGAAGTMFWLDPARGVAGICFTSLVADDPAPWNRAFNDFERLVYNHLEKE